MFDWTWWGSSVVTAVIGSAVGVIALLKYYPERLLGHFLDSRRDRETGERAQQIERLKAELVHHGDRGLRSNEREYQALVAIWDAFIDAFHASVTAIAGFFSYPDFNVTSDEDARDYLERVGFTLTTVSRIMSAHDRREAFVGAMQFKQVADADRLIFRLRDVLRRQALFVSEDLYQALEVAIQELQMPVTTREVELQARRPMEGDRGHDLLGEAGDKLVREVRAAIRARVFRDEN